MALSFGSVQLMIRRPNQGDSHDNNNAEDSAPARRAHNNQGNDYPGATNDYFG